MKKKIYRFVSVAVIAAAMVVSVQMSNINQSKSLVIENIEALANVPPDNRICVHVYTGYCVWDDGFKKFGEWM